MISHSILLIISSFSQKYFPAEWAKSLLRLCSQDGPNFPSQDEVLLIESYHISWEPSRDIIQQSKADQWLTRESTWRRIARNASFACDVIDIYGMLLFFKMLWMLIYHRKNRYTIIKNRVIYYSLFTKYYVTEIATLRFKRWCECECIAEQR